MFRDDTFFYPELVRLARKRLPVDALMMIKNINFKADENLSQENVAANNARAQCYKTFYNRKIQIFIKASFCLWQAFPGVVL